MTGRDIERLIGHFTHAFLLNRPALAIFRAAYDFSKRYYRAPSKMWPSVREELIMAKGVLPLLMVKFDLPWCPKVFCSDATLSGYAVQEASLKTDEIREMGRWSER